jgi:hypothetical protein
VAVHDVRAEDGRVHVRLATGPAGA